ncbi:hypothetical protein B296_00031237, partial [Ensete ventricosum]
SLTDFSELSINVLILQCSEVNQELSLELQRWQAGAAGSKGAVGEEDAVASDGRGGWATLEGEEIAALDLQVGRVSKAKGAVKAAVGKGGRKRAAVVVGGWQWR